MNIGGQAVIEGVMMRNKDKFAVAVRLQNGEIKVRKEKTTKYPKIFNKFFLRGIIGLWFMLYDGVRALIWSSNQQLEEEEELKKGEVTWTVALSFIFAFGVFVGLPFLFAKLIHSEGVWFDVLDGIFRVALFIAYLALISLMKDIRILFQYHGAEHKTIACYEAKEELIPENVRKYSRFHPRCGTSFIVIVLVLSIIIFSLLRGPWWVELLGRLVLIPVIAGIGYELIRFSGKYCKNPIMKIFITPGLWLQRLTTKEPTDKQLEVGIKSLEAVLD
ncbi:DUF1385 domain-containing protein [Candidatus Woesearchaeota archaeon]|jgi:uncharacterized protein YqhQ|nr:DUF1385 domain-containing protein [Candidatus Woesearchaeota archaeon]